MKNRYISLPLLCLTPHPPTQGFPWDDLRKIFRGCQCMAKVPNGEEKLPKISTGWVERTKITDRRNGDSISEAFAKRLHKKCDRPATLSRHHICPSNNGWNTAIFQVCMEWVRLHQWIPTHYALAVPLAFIILTTPYAIPAATLQTYSGLGQERSNAWLYTPWLDRLKTIEHGLCRG